MEYKIVTSKTASGLNSKVNELIAEGWKPEGSHGVVTSHQQPQYRGQQLGQVLYTQEYSQTLTK
jgi:hypothetical protein|tara:strand:- start:399 stop:590 length:192 start_codon:yes stop_codon:yes gene_type:complete